MQASVYNIPAGLPFSKILAQYVLDQAGDSPEKLTEYRLLLPTRRACRVLRDTFLSLKDGQSLLLPRMFPIGDVDEEDLSLMMFGQEETPINIPQAISPLKRQLLLAKLISSAPGYARGHDHALALAKSLAQFIDEVIVEGLDFRDLNTIVPEEFATHWQITLDFLKIITEHWPKILEEQGLIDVADRRNRLMKALAQTWQKNPPNYPVIIAGATGSIPAAANLMGVVSRMPKGQVILPGLDQDLSSEGWEAIEASHPQYALKTALSRMDLSREDVQLLSTFEKGLKGRENLSTAMMLPARVTQGWKSFGAQQNFSEMLQDLQYYACRTQQDEAFLIAVIMRESLEEPRKVTALITPDRVLAARVGAICSRWGIHIDDSAGVKLSDTAVGKFILLVLNFFKKDYDPVSLLSLLKSPLCKLGLDTQDRNKYISQLETVYLRSNSYYGSYDVLLQKIAENEAHKSLHKYLSAFLEISKPLLDKTLASFHEWLRIHIEVSEELSRSPQKSETDILWRGDSGEAASLHLSDLLCHADLIGPVTFKDYSNIFSNLFEDVAVRSPYGLHPRLLILGQLEARMTDVDRVILGGLNEGVWPPENNHDPWMSRPMRKKFGLPSTEQSIGIAAHDFIQGFNQKDVIMTRSEKIDGAPSVRSRWLDRLETVLQIQGIKLDDLSTGPYIGWIEILDLPEATNPYERPQPNPPIAVRPKFASATKIDLWMKDPYAIYMYYILKLRPLKLLETENDAALRGTVLHEILQKFSTKYPETLPENAYDILIEIGYDHIKSKGQALEMLQYWWPRFVRIAEHYIAYEQQWRMRYRVKAIEAEGKIFLRTEAGDFEVRANADRIDKSDEGYAIIDYKTGGTYSTSKLKDGALPQMPIEALILENGGYLVSPDTVSHLAYWVMTGGKEPFKISEVSEDVQQTLDIVQAGLNNLITTFCHSEIPFSAVPDMHNIPPYNDYEHISRLKEWAALDEAEGEAA